MATKLLDSFGAVYAALDQPRIAKRVLCALLLIHTCLLAYSAYVHSPTLNEPGHLVAGLSHWKFGRFDVYNVNPPLVKMVAALPVTAVGYNEDWSGFYEGPGTRPEMGMGENFVAANGERSFFLFMIARWVCIPFSWLGMIVCFLWARDLYGRPCGVLAAAVWCFEPNILAHASLMTPDAGATALGLAACYTFWRWLKNPTWSQAALTGVVLGLAELAKTTLILFYPLWPLMWLIYRWPDRRSMLVRDWLREAGMLALRMVIGLYILNLGYAFEGSFKALKDFHFVSDLFTGDPINTDNPQAKKTNSINRFGNSFLGHLPVPFPKNYLMGIDLQQKDFEHYGRPSYLRGQWRDHGWWYYYLYACAIKVPLGLWALGLFILAARLIHNHRRLASSLRDEFILLFPALMIFCVVSSKTGFSEHMRYVLPTFPFLFIAISQAARICEKSEDGALTFTPMEVNCGQIRPLRRFRLVPLFSASLVSVLVSWLLASSVWVYPHSLSYFNESVGGPLNGSKHLLGSNVDWGQGVLKLDRILNSHPEWGPIAIAYSGPAPPDSMGVRVMPIDWSRNCSPLTGFSHVAISANILAGIHDASGWYSSSHNAANELERFFREQEPVKRLDGSILLFDTEPFNRFYENSHRIVLNRSQSSVSNIHSRSEGIATHLPSLAKAVGSDRLSISGLCHILLLNGFRETGLQNPRTGLEAFRILTDERHAEAVFGKSPFIRTRDGLRYRLVGSYVDDALNFGESHRDQCLSTFALLNFSLEEPIVTESEALHLQDLLSESIANFSFEQSELSWTALAYAKYLPPARSWTNRFGKTTTFSELLRHIMKRGFKGQSCGGLHTLHAIETIVKADYRFGILDARARIDAHIFLKASIDNLIQNQRSDGSWDSGWNNSSDETPTSPASLENRLIATGHILEVLHDLQPVPPAQVFARSTRWLINALATIDFNRNPVLVCPLTHALRAVQLSSANRYLSYELTDIFHNTH